MIDEHDVTVAPDGLEGHTNARIEIRCRLSGPSGEDDERVLLGRNVQRWDARDEELDLRCARGLGRVLEYLERPALGGDRRQPSGREAALRGRNLRIGVDDGGREKGDRAQAADRVHGGDMFA